MEAQKKSIVVVVDVSGSMKGLAKPYIQRNICRYLIQRQQQDSLLVLEFYAWREELYKIELLLDDLPLHDDLRLKPYGSVCLGALKEFLHMHINDGVLLLSDGYWEDDSKAKGHLVDGKLVAIAVGCDVSFTKMDEKLKRLNHSSQLYLAEDVALAIDNLLCTMHNNKIKRPEKILDIKIADDLK